MTVSILREKESFVADAEADMEDPLSVAFRQERKVAYGHVSYGNSPSGTPESLPDSMYTSILIQMKEVFHLLSMHKVHYSHIYMSGQLSVHAQL